MPFRFYNNTIYIIRFAGALLSGGEHSALTKARAKTGFIHSVLAPLCKGAQIAGGNCSALTEAKAETLSNAGRLRDCIPSTDNPP